MKNIKVIAEIGINHDGDVEKANNLIHSAIASGVDAVKFQYRNQDNAYEASSSKEIGDEILLAEIRKTHLSAEDILTLADECSNHRIEVGISFFSADDVHDFGNSIRKFDFFKVPSAELTNINLINLLMSFDKHVYISTGGHAENEIESVLGSLPKNGWTPLHCISNYPLALRNARLGYIKFLLRKWGRAVGYSSHDDHWESCLLAMQLGATVVERHITFDKSGEGLDHSSSSTPKEFAKITRFAFELDRLLAGDEPRAPNQGELLNRQNLGRSYFAASDLSEGSALSIGDLVYRSPNIGLNQTNISDYVGKALIQPVSQGDALVSSMFAKRDPLPSGVIDFARANRMALPVRLHDASAMQAKFPIGSFELHLSFSEVLSDIDPSGFDKNQRYSIHLPDYINSTQLMDPFSPDQSQVSESLAILEKTVLLATKLQDTTKNKVPIVGSFSVVHDTKEAFFEACSNLIEEYEARGITIMPQWLPPIAWYFGGSVSLQAMNNVRDAELLIQHDLPLCLDICHLIMGRNYFGFQAADLMTRLKPVVGHIHIADASGIDGEGLAFGGGDAENIELFARALDFDCLKVIEVWQGHLDQGAGFQTALVRLWELYGS